MAALTGFFLANITARYGYAYGCSPAPANQLHAKRNLGEQSHSNLSIVWKW
jgi:hypothetical protein